MYIHDTQIAGLGKFKLKKLFKAPAKILKQVARAPAKIVKAHVKVVKKVVKAAPKIVKKVAPIAAAALALKFAPALLPMLLARKFGGGGVDQADPNYDPYYDASPQSAPEAIAAAAQSYYGSRLPRPTPQPSSYAAEDAEEAEGQPRQAGFALGGVSIPPALLAAGIAIPLLFIVLPPRRRGSRR